MSEKECISLVPLHSSENSSSRTNCDILVKKGKPKFTAVPSRFLNLTNDFEFAGWGSISHLTSYQKIYIRNSRFLGQFTASALAANDILGGVFYTLPSVVRSRCSPISLFVAALTLFLWRPVMEEMALLFPLVGLPTPTCMLNVSTKSVALFGGSPPSLGFFSHSSSFGCNCDIISCRRSLATIPVYVGAAFVFVLFTVVSLSGLRESARVATGVLAMHVVVMIMLIVASVIAGAEINWFVGAVGLSPAAIARQVMLGLTGFECAPSYTSKMKQNCYPSGVMLLVMALLPLDVVESGKQYPQFIGSKDQVAGRWLRIMVVVDAVVVLCAGVLTVSCDLILPRVFLATVPATGAPYVAIINILTLDRFAMVWLAVMALFPVSLLLLRFSRPRLPRASQCSLFVVAGAISVTVTVAAGNVAIDPTIAGWFALYLIILLVLFYTSQNKRQFTKGWGDSLIRHMRKLRRQEVCLLVKTDEINNLFNMIFTSDIVHFHSGDIPSEMEANARILDEAFPEITVDLMFVEGQFDPKNLAALAHHLKFHGPNFRYSVAELGTRIISI
ncbi:hypothetical protein EV424DRAFT_1466956 [Suillus variegatus]|nr:hypothetical protein EV424DRAFT_1466956 [Suillus variegatus]